MALGHRLHLRTWMHKDPGGTRRQMALRTQMTPKGMDGTRTHTTLGHRWHYGIDVIRTHAAPKGMDGTRTQMTLGHGWH